MGALGKRLKEHRLVVIIYFLCALLTTYPMVLNPFQSVVGHEQASVACHVWVYWWAQNHGADIVTR